MSEPKPKHGIDTFTFNPLKESDLNLLCEWMQKPHVKEWWNDELSTDEIKAKYRERIGSSLVASFISNLNDRPIGFIQYWWPHPTGEMVGMDQFIGEEDYINCGYGTHMTIGFVKKIFKDPRIKKIHVDPNPANHRAIRCYEKAGFKFIRQSITVDGVAYLMEIAR